MTSLLARAVQSPLLMGACVKDIVCATRETGSSDSCLFIPAPSTQEPQVSEKGNFALPAFWQPGEV